MTGLPTQEMRRRAAIPRRTTRKIPRVSDDETSTSPTSNKIRERSQPVNTGWTSLDPSNRLLDRAQTGSTKSGDKASTTLAPNGTYQGDSGEYGQPGGAGEYGRPTSPFCSTTNITIGEEHHTTLHCPGGTIR